MIFIIFCRKVLRQECEGQKDRVMVLLGDNEKMVVEMSNSIEVERMMMVVMMMMVVVVMMIMMMMVGMMMVVVMMMMVMMMIVISMNINVNIKRKNFSTFISKKKLEFSVSTALT